MGKYLIICHDMTGYYYIINLHGDIIISGKTSIEVIGEYCRKYGSTITELSHIVIVDSSKMIYDDEQDKYYTENQLKEEFENDSEKLDIYGNFAAYLAEICGKNGTCEYI